MATRYLQKTGTQFPLHHTTRSQDIRRCRRSRLKDCADDITLFTCSVLHRVALYLVRIHTLANPGVDDSFVRAGTCVSSPSPPSPPEMIQWQDEKGGFPTFPPSSMCPEFPDQEPQFRSHECARAFSVCVCGGVRALLRVYVQVRALHCGAVRCVRACNKQVQKVGVVYAPVILCSLIRCTRGLKTENNVDSSILWRYQSKRATD